MYLFLACRNNLVYLTRSIVLAGAARGMGYNLWHKPAGRIEGRVRFRTVLHRAWKKIHLIPPRAHQGFIFRRNELASWNSGGVDFRKPQYLPRSQFLLQGQPQQTVRALFPIRGNVARFSNQNRVRRDQRHLSSVRCDVVPRAAAHDSWHVPAVDKAQADRVLPRRFLGRLAAASKNLFLASVRRRDSAVTDPDATNSRRDLPKKPERNRHRHEPHHGQSQRADQPCQWVTLRRRNLTCEQGQHQRL